MLQKVMSDYQIPVSQFKKQPAAVLNAAQGSSVAITSHNTIQFYAVPAKEYEALLAEVKSHSSSTKTNDLTKITHL